MQHAQLHLRMSGAPLLIGAGKKAVRQDQRWSVCSSCGCAFASSRPPRPLEVHWGGQPLQLIPAHAAVLTTPPIIRLLRHADLAHRFGHAHALTLQHFNLPQLHHDVFRLLSLPSHLLVLQCGANLPQLVDHLASPEMRLVAETLMNARASILDQIKVLDRRLSAVARATPVVRLFMTAPGVGVITALSVASVFDDASRFKRSSSAGAYLGLTPRRYESGETSRNGRISKQGNQLTRKHLYEAATTLLTRNLRFSTLKAWGMKLAKVSGFKKARVAVARKLAVILHAMWKTNTPFRWSEERPSTWCNFSAVAGVIPGGHRGVWSRWSLATSTTDHTETPMTKTNMDLSELLAKTCHRQHDVRVRNATHWVGMPGQLERSERARTSWPLPR
jgi:hypothetical protein